MLAARRTARAAAAALFVCGATGIHATNDSAACGAGAGEPVTVAGVDDAYDILLGDGRIVTLPGVAFDRNAAAPNAVATWLSQFEIRLQPLDATTDRWGRTPACLSLDRPGKESGRADAAESGLEQGFGLYRPDAGAHARRASLLAAETRAREARRGLWANAPAGILDAADARALARATGYTIVEGRIASVGRAGGRIYLNFGKRRGVDLSIVLSSRNISQFEAQSVEPDRLVGHRIRVRGLVDRGSGQSIEIVSPDAFEILDAREQENPPIESGER